jgi:hypothetical protein
MSCNTTVVRPYQWDKPIKQGKIDRYSIDLTEWLGEDELGTVVATSTNGLVSIVGSGMAANEAGQVNKCATVTVSGVSPGLDEIRFSVATASSGRTEGMSIQLIVSKYP